MRMLSVAIVTVGVVLLGAGAVRAESMSTSSGGGSSGGGIGAGYAAGWSLAPEAKVKKPTPPVKTATVGAATKRTTAGAWSVEPSPVTASAIIEPKTPAPAASTVVASATGRSAPELPETKTATDPVRSN